jgi:hypothetical protein
MTLSIDRETRAKAAAPAGSEPVTREPHAMITAVACVAAVTVIAGVALGVADLAGHGGIHLVMPAMTCFVLAGLSSAVLVIHTMLADRQEFYRRGQLDGWMRGWRGQEPDVDDPLLR